MKKTIFSFFAMLIFAFTACKGVEDPGTPPGTPRTFSITIKEYENGSIEGPASAREGAAITLTISPDSGYELDTISVSGVANLTGSGNGSGATRTFTMPAANVTVQAAFKQLPQDNYPVIDGTIEQKPGQMFFQFNNKTGGQYTDNDIYCVIIGYKPNSGGQLCYVDKNGNMIPASTSLNTHTFDYGRVGADVSFRLSDTNHVRMPNIESGRMYVSYGKPVYIEFVMAADNRLGFAGPDLNNTSDPNRDTFFEFLEFTLFEGKYWGNTTRVDFFSFPVVTRLLADNGYDKTVGDIGTRAELFSAFQTEVPTEFKTLVEDKRIMAPCKRTFNDGQQYADYFRNYIDQIWNQYTNADLVFTCNRGTFRGRVQNNVLKMKLDGNLNPVEIAEGYSDITVNKPNTQDVLEGKGPLADGNVADKVVQAQLCAAINRGVAHLSAQWGNAAYYYQHSTANFYSKFWHDHSINGYAYGFCYDDVFDHSTLLEDARPIALVIDLKW